MFVKMRLLLTSIMFIGTVAFVSPSFAQFGVIPETAADHDSKAKNYREQAAQYKKLAVEHRDMAAAYSRQHPDMKGGVKNPHTQEMMKHCEKLQKEYEQLATDSEKAADYHTMRAKEMRGG